MEDVNGLNPCGFDGSDKCIVKKGKSEPRKMTFKEAFSLPNSVYGFRVFHGGKFKEATPIRFLVGENDVYRIRTGQGIEFIASASYMLPTLDGDKTVEELIKKDFLTINFAATKDKDWEHNMNYFVKVNGIEKLKKYDEEYMYTFLVKGEDKSRFTLANGLVTYDCKIVEREELEIKKK